MQMGKKFWIIFVFLFSLLFCSNLLASNMSESNQGKELDLLKQEINKIKQNYELQLNALEMRLKSVEKKSTESKKEADEAVKKSYSFEHEKKKYNEEIGTIDSLSKKLINGFEFSGYFRSGYGVNGKGGQQVAFQAPGSGAKYRLGNETETYGEAVFAENFNPGNNNPIFKAQVRLAYKNYNDYSGIPGWGSQPDVQNINGKTEQFSVNESFVTGTNFSFLPKASFWVGQRFYRRHHIEINDFYIFENGGYGGGVEDIPLVDDIKLSVGYFGGSNTDYLIPNQGIISKNTIDIRVNDIPLPFGKGMVWIAPSTLNGGSYTDKATFTTKNYESSTGAAFGLVHDYDFDNGGFNEFVVQYGFGSSSNFKFDIPIDYTNYLDTLDDSWQFRATNYGVIQPTHNFSVGYDVIYQINDVGSDNNSRIQWLSAGARPIYNFTKHLALVLEGGVDYVKDDPNDFEGTLWKITVCPELRFGIPFFARPVLRAFFTYATWSNQFQGRVGGTPYADTQAGTSFGLQTDVWW